MLNINYRPVKVTIDLNALKSNLRKVRAYAPKAKVLAMIKANGYGHGMSRVAEQLTQADAFGVASIDEAIKLRHKGFLHRILLLEGLFNESEFPLVIQHRLDFVIHSQYQLNWLVDFNPDVPLNIWIKYDTGMHRLGFLPKEKPLIESKLNKLRKSHNLHVMSHFASADEDDDFTQLQINRFNELTNDFLGSRSLANSAGIQVYPESHYDWVRPGIMLYGAGEVEKSNEHSSLKPVMTFSTQITSLKWIEAGEGVGYGQTWQACKKSLIGVLAVGYGDGYPRHAPTGTPILIHGKKVPIVGRVSMDMVTVDLTEIAHKVEVGDEAVLWGNGLSVDEVAEHAGTIGYELLCGITPRVPFLEKREF